MDWRVREVLEALKADDGTSATVMELAEMVGLSANYLRRLFKNEVGVSITKVQSESRLQTAARLLQSTQLNVSESAYAAGYKQPSHFSRSFKLRFGMTPREFREQMHQRAVTTWEI